MIPPPVLTTPVSYDLTVFEAVTQTNLQETEATKTYAPPTDPPRSDAPKKEPPKTDPPKAETRRTGRLSIQTHRPQTPHTTTPFTFYIAPMAVDIEAEIMSREYLHQKARDERNKQGR